MEFLDDLAQDRQRFDRLRFAFDGAVVGAGTADHFTVLQNLRLAAVDEERGYRQILRRQEEGHDSRNRRASDDRGQDDEPDIPAQAQYDGGKRFALCIDRALLSGPGCGRSAWPLAALVNSVQ